MNKFRSDEDAELVKENEVFFYEQVYVWRECRYLSKRMKCSFMNRFMSGENADTCQRE